MLAAIIISIISMVLILSIIGVSIAYYIYDRKINKDQDKKIQDEQNAIADLKKKLNTQNDNISGISSNIATDIRPNIRSITTQVSNQTNSISGLNTGIKSINDQVYSINTNIGSNIQPIIKKVDEKVFRIDNTIDTSITPSIKNINDQILVINGKLVNVGNLKTLNVSETATIGGDLAVNGNFKLGTITMNADGTIAANKLKVSNIDVENKAPFIGPQGPVGPVGPIGPIGPQGPQLQGDVKVNKIRLGDKFALSGVGDAHGNDGWLRLFNKDGTGYYGGMAVGELWSGSTSYLNGNTYVNGKLSTTQGISVTNPNPGPLIDKNYGNDADRYGIGQFNGGASRVYTASSYGPATVNLSLAKNNNQFDDIVTIKTDRTTTISGQLNANADLNVTGNSKSATLNTTGAATIGNNLNVTGNSKSATLTTTGIATIGTDLNATGNVNGAALCIQGRCLTLADINKIKAL